MQGPHDVPGDIGSGEPVPGEPLDEPGHPAGEPITKDEILDRLDDILGELEGVEPTDETEGAYFAARDDLRDLVRGLEKEVPG